MAKHMITVEANGNTYKVETDADIISIGGVEFKFNSANELAICKARFLGYQSVHRKLACIKAVREASAERRGESVRLMSIHEAKKIVEEQTAFVVLPAERTRFEATCRENSIEPTYV